MTQPMPLEFDVRREVLPVLAVGVALNLAGRYFADTYLQLPWTGAPNYLFLDQIGTAFTAMLLGPWWGATVGLLGSAITGVFANRFFPFGTVSVATALVWGYAARLPWIRSRLALPRAQYHRVRDAVYALIALSLAGGCIAAAASVVTKIVLYTRLELPLDLRRPYYLGALRWAEAHGWPAPAVTSLLAADVVREVVDKSLTVALAFAVVLVFGFIPSAAERHELMNGEPRRREQLKVSALSIFVFTIVYAMFLLAARIATPEISYPEATRRIPWLRDNTVVLMLYSPVLMALGAFLLSSFDAKSPLGRRVDRARRQRQQMYRRLMFRPGAFEWSELFKIARRDSAYGVLAAVLLWRQQLGTRGSALSALYFGVATAFAIVFFHERRHFAARWYAAKADLTTLQAWLAVGEPRCAAGAMLDLLAANLGSSAFIWSDHNVARGHITCRAATVDSSSGFARYLSQQRRNDRVLFAVPAADGAMSSCVCGDIDEAMVNAGCDTAMVVTTTPEPVEEHVAAWLRRALNANRDVVLMGWEDVENSIVAAVKKDDATNAIAQARVHLMSALSAQPDRALLHPTAVALANRSLRGVSHILAHLPVGSRVCDFGGGRGRHTFAAALRGHHVTYVERRSDVHREVEALLTEARLGGVVTWNRDYREVTPEAVGPVDLLIVTGVLQHTQSRQELADDLRHFTRFLAAPGSALYIEMLYDMSFDGKEPGDGRHAHSRKETEQMLLAEVSGSWRVARVGGPYRRRQDFTDGPRSFIPAAPIVESTAVEYLLVHE